MTPRRFKVEHRRSWIDANHWRLITWGDGHWCVASDHGSWDHFPTEAEAITAGELWAETGLPACDQSPENIARRRAQQQPERIAA